MSRFPHSTKKPRRGADPVRQLVVVGAIGACLGLAAFGIQDYAAFRREAAATAAAAAAASDDEVYTGSILYMPDRGNLCRQLLFDNQNGQFTDRGFVDCERAAYSGASSEVKHWPTARVRVISSGFRGQ